MTSPASKDVDAFHPISDKRERSTAYLTLRVTGTKAAAKEHAPPVVDVPVFDELNKVVGSVSISRGHEAHGHDDHACQCEHIHFKAGADIVHFAINPHVQHRIERMHDVIYKDVVTPRAAVAMDTTSEKKGGGGGKRMQTIEFAM